MESTRRWKKVELEVFYQRYMDGASRPELAEQYNVSLARVGELIPMACRAIDRKRVNRAAKLIVELMIARVILGRVNEWVAVNVDFIRNATDLWEELHAIRFCSRSRRSNPGLVLYASNTKRWEGMEFYKIHGCYGWRFERLIPEFDGSTRGRIQAILDEWPY